MQQDPNSLNAALDPALDGRKNSVAHRLKFVAVVILLLVFPAYQFLATRSLTYMALISLGFVELAMLNQRYYLPLSAHISAIMQNFRQMAVLWPLVIFLVWMGISLFWSLLPIAGLFKLLACSTALFAAALYTNDIRNFRDDRIIWVFLAGIVVASLLYILEIYQLTAIHKFFSPNNKLWDLNRNLGGMTFLVWLVFLIEDRTFVGKWSRWAILLLVGFVIMNGQSESAKLAFILAGSLYLISQFWPKILKLVPFVVAFHMVAFPFAIKALKSVDVKLSELSHFFVLGSADARIDIWKTVQELIFLRPLFGFGGGMTNYWRSDVVAQSDRHTNLDQVSGSFSNPHNLVLEIWLNFGAVGIGIAIWFVFAYAKTFENANALTQRVAMVCFTVGFVYANTFSSFFQGWFLVTIAMTMISFRLLLVQNEELRSDPE
jgi:O-antigen ligase